MMSGDHLISAADTYLTYGIIQFAMLKEISTSSVNDGSLNAFCSGSSRH
jgi:hypothetical protein